MTGEDKSRGRRIDELRHETLTNLRRLEKMTPAPDPLPFRIEIAVQVFGMGRERPAVKWVPVNTTPLGEN